MDQTFLYVQDYERTCDIINIPIYIYIYININIPQCSFQLGIKYVYTLFCTGKGLQNENIVLRKIHEGKGVIRP